MDSGLLRGEREFTNGLILVAVQDLIFLSKILQTGREVGARLETVELSRLQERLRESGACAVIVDLNPRSGSAVDAARAIKSDPATAHVRILGFLSHVQAEVAREARAAGLDLVMARSAFTEQLPHLLLKLAQP